MANKKLLLPIIIISILLTLSCSIFKLTQVDSIPLYTLESNEKFETVWNATGLEIPPNSRRSNIVGLPGKIVFISRKSGWNQTGSLVALDSLTGNIVWTSPGASLGEIISHGENLYRGIYGSATIYSYDAKNGNVLWHTRLPGGHSVSDLFFAEDKIFAYTNDFEFFILDSTGKIIDSFSETDRVFLEIENILYMDDLGAIKAIASSTKKELWKVRLKDEYTYAPIFDNGTIYLRTEGGSPSIYSIDQITGTVYWEKTVNIISNLYITDTKIYFIDQNSNLIELDKGTGDDISNIKISPSIDTYKLNKNFFVSGDAANNLLALYFGDGNQIICLKILNP